jgi:ABC-2 type transport system ATP-binding protein
MIFLVYVQNFLSLRLDYERMLIHMSAAMTLTLANVQAGRMDPRLLLAAAEHEPPHGIPLFVAAIVLAGGLVLRLRKEKAQKGFGRGRQLSDRGPSSVGSDVGVRSDGRGARGSRSVRALSRDSIVTVKGLTKRYGQLVAVEDLTFSLEPGTVTGFLGPNGAGKTTTLRLLLGLARPTAGEALVFGRRYEELDSPAGHVGAVLESNDFDPGRSGRDHLRTCALAAALPQSRVDQVLRLVELEAAAGRRVRTYSLGMRQRLSLAAALLGDPELLVLDEPANGLDPAGVHWLRSFLRRFAEHGRTVLVSSHLLAEVAQSVDRVLIIDRGRLVADTLLDELAARGQTLEDAYLELTAGDAS